MAQVRLRKQRYRVILISIGVLSFGLSYVLGSRAIDTGSWWEYGGTLTLIVFGVNRIVSSIRSLHKH